MNFIFFNESFIPAHQSYLPVTDLAVERAYAVFDFCRMAGDQPLFIDDHLNRFFYSAEQFCLQMPYNRQHIKDIITELIRRNDVPDASIRMTLTGGDSLGGNFSARPSFFIVQQPYTSPGAEVYKKGIRLSTYEYQRQAPDVKSIDYITPIMLQKRGMLNDADDLLYFNKGAITESPRSNFFMVTKDEKIVTPAANILRGITRKKVLEAAKAHFEVEERSVSLDDLRNAAEAFITSTTKHVLPVSKIDNLPFKSSKVTSKVSELFEAIATP